ncbi:hypothetical protein NDU88_000195 [Pleurodeles waltl]|uniref:Uncharacterized protein n=1 Tax=Pleurodeles waltl TaxID=8319 RepID=A0AAV7TEA7_PLEWA|nr:hypothetical protein NDU88_000195 [Pleurodeles waltl]
MAPPPGVGDRPRIPGRGETRQDCRWRGGRRPAGLRVRARGETRPALDNRRPAGARKGPLPRGGGLTARDPRTGRERHPRHQRHR